MRPFRDESDCVLDLGYESCCRTLAPISIPLHCRPDFVQRRWKDLEPSGH
jgi:hypothetical protein